MLLRAEFQFITTDLQLSEQRVQRGGMIGRIRQIRHRVEADITVDQQGRGDYLSLDEAVRAALASSKAETTIQVLGGTWQKPTLPKKSKVNIILREGAAWE